MDIRRSAALLACSAIAATALFAAPRTGEDPAPTTPPVSWHGARSQINDRQFLRLRTDTAWRELWQRHTGSPDAAARGNSPAPTIDFDHFEIVGFFRGPAINTDGELVESIHVYDHRVLVRFNSSTYQTASFDGRGGAVDTIPFGLWLIPRSDKPIDIEENVQGLLDHPPIWKQQTRLEVPK